MLEGGGMRYLNNESLEGITGGLSTWAAIGISAIVIFLAGVIDGIVHPNKCE